MKTIVAATILKCTICGTTMELEPKKYPVANGDEKVQLHVVTRLALEDFSNTTIHSCNLDRTWGIFDFAGIKHYRTLEGR